MQTSKLEKWTCLKGNPTFYASAVSTLVGDLLRTLHSHTHIQHTDTHTHTHNTHNTLHNTNNTHTHTYTHTHTHTHTHKYTHTNSHKCPRSHTYTRGACVSLWTQT